jgi:leucyl-tRNA synthetase
MSKEEERVLHETIKKVTEDTETLDFNTAISQMMIFMNTFSKAKTLNRDAIERFIKLLSPYAPHITEELWHRLGHEETLAYEPWPDYDEEKLKIDEVEILIQLTGKPKARIMMPADATPEQMKDLALNAPEVAAALDGKNIIKVIPVPGRLVNIVAK